MTVRTVLFDLDGTLLDTAPDFATVLDGMRAELGLAPMPFSAFRATVSHGATAMLGLAFPGLNGDDLERQRQAFLERYYNHLYVHTRLFPGMDAVLDTLESRGQRWGIVTNKPAWLTQPLLEQAGLHSRVACVVSGDTLPERKPHPAPVLHGCTLAESEPAQTVYIGDAERDIQSGKAAGVRTAVAMFGYIHPDENPADWGADAYLEHPGAVLEWVA